MCAQTLLLPPLPLLFFLSACAFCLAAPLLMTESIRHNPAVWEGSPNLDGLMILLLFMCSGDKVCGYASD